MSQVDNCRIEVFERIAYVIDSVNFFVVSAGARDIM